MASADFQEMQGMLGKITGMPQEGPEKPSWFSSASSPEWQSYNNYYEMQKQIQRASLLQELDQRLNPISLGESARFLGKQPGDIAAPGQMRDITQDVQFPTVEEGPRPMGMRTEMVPRGTRPGEPEFQHTPYGGEPEALFSYAELADKPLLKAGMDRDFLDKKEPYYRPTEVPNMVPEQVPTVLQGPGAPVPGQPRAEKVVTGREPDVSAPASKLQRDMVQAELHRRSLQEHAPRARSEAEVKAEMAQRYRQDPERYYGEGVASGAIGTDQNVKRTDSGVGLAGAKSRNLDAQTEYTKRTLEPRIAQMQANTQKARQEVVEMKNLTDPKRQKMLGEITKNEAYVEYLKSRSDGRDAELALKESKLYAMLSEVERKHALAQLAAAKELHKSGDFTDEMFDDILGGIFKNLNVEGVHSAPSLGQRLGSMLGGEPLPEEEPAVGGPNLKAGPQTGETSSLRMKQHETRGKSAGTIKTPIMPNIEQGPGTPPPPPTPKANADDVAGAMAKEMGDLKQYEGKTIKDGKTGRRFKVTKGKLVEVK